MENLVGVLIAILIAVIILYNVVLPTNDKAMFGQANLTGNGAWNLTSPSNLSSGMVSLSATVQTLLVATLIIYVVKSAFF